MKAVDIGFGTLKFNGWIQAWFSDGTGTADNTFRLRRAELRMVGQVNRSVSWVLQFDAAKALTVNTTYTDAGGTRVLADQSISQGSRMLQDAMISVRPNSSWTVDAGQFRIPLTHEGAMAPWKFETVEQPMFVSDRSRGGGVANVRDVGVMVHGSVVRAVEVFAGAFNGSGESQNAQDRNDQKAIIGRLLVRPWRNGLVLGASGVYGGSSSADHPRRDRSAAEARYESSRVTVRTELIRAADGETHREGWYVLGAYRVLPSLETVARVDSWDPDVAREGTPAAATAREGLVGINRYLDGHNARLQLNVSRRWYADSMSPTVTLLVMGIQAAW